MRKSRTKAALVAFALVAASGTAIGVAVRGADPPDPAGSSRPGKVTAPSPTSPPTQPPAEAKVAPVKPSETPSTAAAQPDGSDPGEVKTAAVPKQPANPNPVRSGPRTSVTDPSEPRAKPRPVQPDGGKPGLNGANEPPSR